MRTLVTLLLSAFLVRAVEPSKEDAEFFESKVRPILVERCFSCHSEQAQKTKGGLALDSLTSLLAGGDGGAVVVPKDPSKSRLIEAINHTKADFQMPPKGKLPDSEIEILIKWVSLGVPWPNSRVVSPKRRPGTITAKDREWWSFQPIKTTSVPTTSSAWTKNEVDHFIWLKLKSSSLTPAPEAGRLILIRRLTYDLHGLPPTPAEVDAFVNDPSPSAVENLVDRLLASPRYGERQARFWLDLVRYADSDGYRIDDYRPTAWRYRDYVIRSFNADKGYDRFTQEQLAGDELFPGDIDAMLATGYLRHWIYEYNNRDARGQWTTVLNDITDTTADVFLGLGLQCARCHDHKFDPILQKDYYRLQAFFAGLRPRDDLVTATPQQLAEHAAKLKVWQDQTATIRAEIDRLEEPYRRKEAKGAIAKFPDDVQAMMLKPEGARTPYEQQIHELAYRQVDYEYSRLDKNIKGADKEKLLALRRELAKFNDLRPPPLPLAFAATEIGSVAPPVTIPKKGDIAIEPGFPTILDEKPAKIVSVPGSTGRRATLARWLTQPDHPLAARVIVNRIWQQHFGRGLAVNTSDFGHLGEPPTHPELLDWLASQFVKEGWSLKQLHRRIVLSATYRQSAKHENPSAGRLIDPENKLLWKAPVRRLEAEQIRDALFSLSGELNLKEFGPGVAGSEPRRTIYVKIMRNNRDPLLDVFDAPYWFSSVASRDTTTTPVQSLLLINSPSMLARGRAFATRLEREEPNEAKRVALAYRLAFGRNPNESEIATGLQFLDDQAKTIDPLKSASAQAAFVGGKIPYRDGQAADLKMAGGFQIPGDKLPTGHFTIEAFVYPRSIAENAAVRTIAAHWNGSNSSPGWNFGITGKQSRRKPQTLVVQLIGTKRDGSKGEEAVFSDQHIAMNKPYYVSAAVTLATEKKPGQIVFSVKDLSNDDEPLLIAKVAHEVVSGLENTLPMTLGSRSGKNEASFDGLLDDVRLSGAALGVDELLFTREGMNKHTVGYWQFEAKPGVFKDSAGHGLDITPKAKAVAPSKVNVRSIAWADFCHVLLNTSEFLYVE